MGIPDKSIPAPSQQSHLMYQAQSVADMHSPASTEGFDTDSACSTPCRGVTHAGNLLSALQDFGLFKDTILSCMLCHDARSAARRAGRNPEVVSCASCDASWW